MGLLKKLFSPLMLTASIISGLSGCTTVSPWVAKTESKFVSSSIVTGQSIESKIVKEKTFHISEPELKNDNYQVQIKESLKEKTYNCVPLFKETVFEDINFNERTVHEDYSILGLISGVSIIPFISGLIFEGSSPEDPSVMVISASLGGLVGLVLGIVGDDTVEQVKTNTKLRSEKIPQGTREEYAFEKMVYAQMNSNRVKVGIVGENSFYTDDKGIATFPKTQNMFFTRESLEEGIEDYWLMSQVKYEFKDRLENMVLDEINPSRREITFETRESSFKEDEKIKNDSERFDITFYEIKDEHIYSAVNKFVVSEINSKIKPVTFYVEDNISHFPITNTTFQFNVFAPSKKELADRYFSGNLSNYAQTRIKDYVSNSQNFNCSSMLRIDFYCPSEVNLEVIHSQYNYVFGNFNIIDGTKKTVYMVDKGEKVRIDNTPSGIGRIE